MRPGREIDTQIATEVFGYKVWARGKILHENPPQGERPLRKYSREMEWAWEVAKKMKITLIPIIGDQWFAFVGPADKQGWESPEAVLKILQEQNFAGCGAAFGDEAPMVICMAALNAIKKRQQPTPEEPQTKNPDGLQPPDPANVMETTKPHPEIH